MSETLPLFPLGTVLYPGLCYRCTFSRTGTGSWSVISWRIRAAEFGVIAIRRGRETGVDGISALHEIGCIATLRQVTEHDDGGFDLVTVGTQRFRCWNSTTRSRTCRVRWTCSR